ncbi:MAG: adenylyl-sulfate kinase, partial [Elusimicrobia bacterium RIFOXYD12_FULL_66_9]
MTEESLRQSLRVVITGHVDHGKSTVIGRLLVETGALPQGKLERIRSYCERNSKPFEFAFLLDALKDEQAQGITVEASRIFFKTPLRDYIIVDAPGHVEFLRNMVSGASQASAALLVLDAKEGVRENSRRHGYLLSMLGIGQVVVLVNKMDLVGYGEEAFLALSAEYRAFLSGIGVTAAHFIPVSGLHGDNLAERSARMGWYHGQTVLEALDSFAAEPSLTALPFRMPVQGVCKFTNEPDARRVVVGSAESGSLSVGDEVVFYPSGKSSSVRAIEEFPSTLRTRIFAGMATGFSLADEIYVRRGEIAARREDPPPHVATRFKTRLIWLGREPLSPGKDYILKSGAARVTARLGEVSRVLDSSTLETRERAANIARHEVADCVLETASAIAFDLAGENVVCGRFVLIDDHEICGGGLIHEALGDDSSWVRDKVLSRNIKWQGSSIPRKRRAERYGQKPALVLVTGARDSQRKAVARALESRLFELGRSVYFLGIGSALYGVSADIRDADNHPEDIRRLAEIAHIIMDSGLILIVSAGELKQEDLDIIQTAIDVDRIETVWVGPSVTTDLVPDAVVPETTAEDAVAAVLKRL